MTAFNRIPDRHLVAAYRVVYLSTWKPVPRMQPKHALSAEDERSWRLNEAALDAASTDWGRSEGIIRRNLARLAAERTASPELIMHYRQLVDRGPAALRNGVLALTDRGQALRSLHPLAGLIDPRMRHRILRETPLR